MLKLHYPQLGHEINTQQAMGRSDVMQSILPVVDSICHSAQLITAPAGHLSFLGPLVPSLAHSMFLAAKVLIIYGGGAIPGSDNAGKVQMLVRCIEIFAKRWRSAGEFVTTARTRNDGYHA